MVSPELQQVAEEIVVELPYEHLARVAIKNELKAEFDLAAEVFDLAIGLFAEKIPMNPGPGLDDDVIVTVLGLLAKSCKQHRAIVLLVEQGIDEVASSNVRMLFETMAATTFLTRHRIILKENGKRISPVPGKTLTTRFRSSLYRANEAFQYRKFHRGLSEWGDSDRIPHEIQKQVEDACAGWEKVIGPVWTERVKRKGYAGVSIKDLSESLGMGALYATMYRLHSAGVHGTDAANHSEFDEGFGWRFSVLPSTEGIAFSLGFTTLMMIAILKTVDRRLNLGIRQRIKDLSKKVAKMRYEFPDMKRREKGTSLISTV
jgi:uncharacterized protein DUF5677